MTQQQYRLVLAALCFLLCHFGKFPANGQIGPGGGGGGGGGGEGERSELALTVWLRKREGRGGLSPP